MIFFSKMPVKSRFGLICVIVTLSHTYNVHTNMHRNDLFMRDAVASMSNL